MLKGTPENLRDQRWHRRHLARIVRRKSIRVLHMARARLAIFDPPPHILHEMRKDAERPSLWKRLVAYVSMRIRQYRSKLLYG